MRGIWPVNPSVAFSTILEENRSSSTMGLKGIKIEAALSELERTAKGR